MDTIDLRSDTVTLPTPEMREAMATADVGDDVYGEDPTINKLQGMAAEMMGMEAGLFVASGTMGNLAAILAHCQRGDEIIVGKKNHVFLNEAGGISALGGIHSYQVPNQTDGSLAVDDIASAIRSDDAHEPISRLICLENTHNACGGTYQSREYVQEICQYAHEHGLLIHIDGARIFNAAAAQGVSAKELTAPADSVTFCLSKGLCAPVGSVLCGSKKFITKAHRLRKLLGGGMRQAGFLAAAGITALEVMPQRLWQDHERAKKLALGLKQIPGLVLAHGIPATNMVFIRMTPEVNLTTVELYEKLKNLGVLIDLAGDRYYRLVTHYWITNHMVDSIINAFRDALNN
jgi:threonine aldolase